MVPQAYLKSHLIKVVAQMFVVCLNPFSNYIKGLTDLYLEFFVFWGMVDSILTDKL